MFIFVQIWIYSVIRPFGFEISLPIHLTDDIALEPTRPGAITVFRDAGFLGIMTVINVSVRMRYASSVVFGNCIRLKQKRFAPAACGNTVGGLYWPRVLVTSIRIISRIFSITASRVLEAPIVVPIHPNGQ